MSAQFTVSPIKGGGVLVEGTDAAGREGMTILRSESWEYVVEYRRKRAASEEFDQTVEEFFAPIIDAADKFAAAGTVDGDTVVVLDEGVEGAKAVEPFKVHLDAAGVVLRTLAEGDHDTLRWVGSDLVVVG